MDNAEKNHFLLIGISLGDPWRQVMEEALASLGTLQIVREVDALRLARQQDYDLIVIDATNVEDIFLLALSIRLQRPNAKIVIATASPDWKLAREAFRTGATDYIQKSMNKEEILSTLRTAMDKIPPPWGR